MLWVARRAYVSAVTTGFSKELTAQGLLADDVARMLARLAPFTDVLRGKKLLITGATGFFGKWLLAGLAELNQHRNVGLEITALSRSPERFLESYPSYRGLSGVRYLAADVATFTEALPHVDLAIHAATEAARPGWQQNASEVIETTVNGTRLVLAALQKAGVKRVVTTSSGAVYGKQPSELTHLPETYLGAPDCMDPATTTAYAEGKRLSELLGVVAAKEHGFDFISARCFAFIGGYLPLDAHFAAGNFIRDVMEGGPITIGGDGTPHRSYLYAGDLVVWLMTLLLKGVSGRAYNVGSDESVSIKTLAQRIAAIDGDGCAVEIKTPLDPSKPIARYVPSIDRARTELGLDVFTPLDDAIARMLAVTRSTN